MAPSIAESMAETLAKPIYVAPNSRFDRETSHGEVPVLTIPVMRTL